MEPLKGRRYNESFKIYVIKEIRAGKFTPAEAERHYGIKGHSTVNKWLKKYSKDGLNRKRVIERLEREETKVEKLEKRIRELEKALSDSFIENRVNKELVKLAKIHYGIDLKKNSDMNVSNQSFGASMKKKDHL